MNDRSACTDPALDAPSRGELLAVLLTGVGHVALELASDGIKGAADTLNRPQQIYNLVACFAWLIYMVWRVIRQPQILDAWGVRRGAFQAALRLSLLFALPATVLLAGVGLALGRFPIPDTFWIVLVLYPLWGIAQQFALQALVTRNLRGILPCINARSLVVAGLFSLAHFPNAWLMLLVFPAGLVFTWVFERHRNIYAIGLVHGLLGSLAYYLILGQDPGADLLSMVSNILGR